MNDRSISGFMCIVVCICRKNHAFNSQQYECLGRSLNPECSLQRAMSYASHNTGASEWTQSNKYRRHATSHGSPWIQPYTQFQ